MFGNFFYIFLMGNFLAARTVTEGVCPPLRWEPARGFVLLQDWRSEGSLNLSGRMNDPRL